MSNEHQHIPAGYKPSPLGSIPEDWEVKKLGEVVTVNSGKDYKHLSVGNIPVYGTGGYMLSVNDKLSDIDAVGIGRKGTIDKPQYLRAPFWTVDTLFFLTTKENYDLRFVFNLSQLVEWKKYSEQTGVPSLTSKSINNIQIAVPPFPEQHRIVSVLQLWDAAIAKQTELVEKLTLRKRGLMQKLLTGKKRLKGFSGEWKEVRLGEVAFVIGGGTPNTDISDYWSGDIPWFTPSEIGENKYVNISERTISEKGLNDSSAKILPKGTILFTSRATIGAKAILTTEATTNQGFQSFVVNNENSNEFIYYYLDIILNEIKQKASGSTFPEVSAESLRKILIKIPDINEQNAIASVLVNADKEIELANKKLARLQEEKKGLMQVLLTGKKRIVKT